MMIEAVITLVGKFSGPHEQQKACMIEPVAASFCAPPPNASRCATADLADAYFLDNSGLSDVTGACSVHVMEPMFRDYGGRTRFSGQAATIKCFESNRLVHKMLNQPGNGRVLVVDAGGSRRCALLGDCLANLALENNWSGVIILGCIRDAEDLEQMPLGVKALGSHPVRASKEVNDAWQANVPVNVAGVTVHPGDWVYADKDGVLVSQEELKL